MGFHVGNEVIQLIAAKEAINEYIRTGIEQGKITNRQDIVKTLQDAGLKLNRSGKDYITVQDPDSGEKLRLKGQIYAERWKYTGLPRREDEAEDRAKQADCRADDARAVQCPKEIIVAQELAGIIQSRLEYNRKRYPPRAYNLGRELFQTLPDGTPLFEHQHGADGANPVSQHSNRLPWDDDLLQIQTPEHTGRSAHPYSQSSQLEKSNEPLARKNMGLGATQGQERTFHTSPQGDTDRPRTMENGQQERFALDNRGQIGANHDGNRAFIEQNPHQDGTGIDHYAGQASGRATALQKGTTRTQGASDTFAKSTTYTEQAIAKFEQCLRELTALVGKVEQYIIQKLEKEKHIEEKCIQYTRFRV